MDALNSYLHAATRNKKRDYEQPLSLPRIPERPLKKTATAQSPGTAIHPRFKKSVNKQRQFVSETTLSP